MYEVPRGFDTKLFFLPEPWPPPTTLDLLVCSTLGHLATNQPVLSSGSAAHLARATCPSTMRECSSSMRTMWQRDVIREWTCRKASQIAPLLVNFSPDKTRGSCTTVHNSGAANIRVQKMFHAASHLIPYSLAITSRNRKDHATNS